MDQMLGNLFSRGQPLEALERASFHSLSYWDEWHKIMAREERRKTDGQGA